MCVSHCWGSDPGRVPKTLKANIESFQDRIPWDSLSAKFQESITFTWTLGIRRIWIDSLCIIQDDNADWQVQGAQMGSIYSNSHLTISAVRSSNADDGLFSAADSVPAAYELCMPGQDDAARPSGLLCRPLLSHVQHSEGRLTEQEEIQLDLMSGILQAPESKFVNTPLIRRAWVLQERLLSPRVLHFGREELSWECVEHCACQCSESLHYGGLSGLILDSNGQPFKNAEGNKSALNPKREFSPAALAAVIEADGAVAIFRKWIRLVQEYSTLQLTYKSDIFPALSGLAKAFGHTLSANYYAGLWQGFLQTGLLWKVTGRGGRSEPWRAPSWSWASADTPVRYFLKDEEEELLEQCQVVDISCSSAASDPMAQLTAGYIVLRGLLFTSKVRHQAGRLFHGDVINFDFMHNRSGRPSADYDMTVPGPGYIAEGMPLSCFFVGKGSRWKQNFVLVLKPVAVEHGVDAASVETYKRVGVIEVPEWTAEGVDVFGRLLSEASETNVRII